MTTALPTQVTYGTFKGHLIDAVNTGAGEVSRAVTGTVIATPQVNSVNIPAALVVMLPRPVYATLDATGAFTMQLVATDDPALSVLNWAYQISFQLNNGDALAPFLVQIPGGSTVDLSTANPVSTGGGVAITQGPPGPPGAAFPAVATVAALPAAASGNAGNAYYVTATALVYVSDGIKWNSYVRGRFDNTVGNRLLTWDANNAVEQVVYGDTGLRDVSASLITGWTGYLQLRRIGNTVFFYTYALTGGTGHAFVVPPGFLPSPPSNGAFTSGGRIDGLIASLAYDPTSKALTPKNCDAGGYFQGYAPWVTADPWPTALPGVAG